MPVSDLADWWDRQKRDSETILTEWVQDNPQWWCVGVAGTVQTTMDLGAGLVDVLRFGEGTAEGGALGVGKDVLRLLMLLGPLARAGGAAARFITPLLQSGRLRIAVQVGGVDGPCTFQAVNNALSIAKGRNLFITVDDMAQAMGKNISQLAKTAQGDYSLGAWVDELVPVIREAGVKVKEVKGLTNIQEVVAAAKQESGPVIFAIRSMIRNASGVAEEILHSVIAQRSASGAVRFADYGGRFVNTLDDILNQWGTRIAPIDLLQSGSSATVINPRWLTGEIATKLAKGVFLVFEGLAAITTDNGVEFAVPAVVVASSAPALDQPVEKEVIKGSFEAYKARATGRKVIRLPDIVITAGRKRAPPSHYLTGVQYRLNALGFGAGKVDGIMGPRTRKAVLGFQRAYPPLQVDGIPGPKTQAKLVDVCGY